MNGFTSNLRGIAFFVTACFVYQYSAKAEPKSISTNKAATVPIKTLTLDGKKTALEQQFDLFDLAGLKLGIDRELAVKILEEQGYVISESSFNYPSAPAYKIRNGIFGRKKSPLLPAVEDTVYVWLAYPPFKLRVLGVRKKLTFAPENAPLMISYLDSAKNKAGFETFRDPVPFDGTTAQLIQWGDNGKPIKNRFGSILNNITSTPSRVHSCQENYVSFGSSNNIDFYQARVLALSTDRTSIPFLPGEFCGTTYFSSIFFDLQKRTRSIDMFLIDQKAMVIDSKYHWHWLRAASASYKEQVEGEASQPQF